MSIREPTMTTAKTPAVPDPTTDDALTALDLSYAAAPDMPIAVAILENASLARLARARHTSLAKVGIPLSRIERLATFATRLGALETGWRSARAKVKLTAADRKLLAEAEALDSKLLAGGRWACRKDPLAQDELSRIAEGSGLTDTIQDLCDLVTFWAAHEAERSSTDITPKDLARAAQLAERLDAAAANEASDIDAAAAIELRNRVFWAADELAKEIREGGRYAFRLEPKIGAKFVSSYRSSANRRAKRKLQATKGSKASSATPKTPTTK